MKKSTIIVIIVLVLIALFFVGKSLFKESNNTTGSVLLDQMNKASQDLEKANQDFNIDLEINSGDIEFEEPELSDASL
jgi:peptidoglycan hydrolase CwlO-like protein